MYVFLFRSVRGLPSSTGEGGVFKLSYFKNTLMLLLYHLSRIQEIGSLACVSSGCPQNIAV